MKTDYWNVTDQQVVEKTGEDIAHWIAVLDAFKAGEKKSTDVVEYLEMGHEVPRYWARTLTTLYQRRKEGEV